MVSFEEFFLESVFRPRPNDVFFHGSVGDFEPSLITGNVHKDGLVYLTRNINHVLDYAQTHNNFGSRAPVTKGFIYAYKIDPSAKIFDATQNRDHWGYTEIMQDPENTGETVFKLLKQGYDGILQKQANLDSYGDFQNRYVNRSQFNKGSRYDKSSKDRWKKKVPLESGFSGTQVLGIKPEFLVPVRKIPLDDAYEGLYPDYDVHGKKSKRITSDFYKTARSPE